MPLCQGGFEHHSRHAAPETAEDRSLAQENGHAVLDIYLLLLFLSSARLMGILPIIELFPGMVLVSSNRENFIKVQYNFVGMMIND